jgi:hypothetical protein
LKGQLPAKTPSSRTLFLSVLSRRASQLGKDIARRDRFFHPRRMARQQIPTRPAMRRRLLPALHSSADALSMRTGW